MMGLILCAQAVVRAAPVAVGRSVLLPAHLPWYFEPNHGQAATGVTYIARGPACLLSFKAETVLWVLANGRTGRDAPILMRLVGAYEGRRLLAEGPLDQRRHYYLGNDPRRWHTEIPAFARLRYRQLYPGIDLLFYGKGPHLEYDFEVAPGAEPEHIVWSFSGAEQLRLDDKGDLQVRATGRRLVFHRPHAYQEIDGARRAVASHYVIQGERVSFGLAAYDRSRPLIIDPVVDYSAYLGGGGTDTVNAVTVDAAGNSYVTGRTNSPGLQGVINGSALQGSFDAFISKFDATGALVYTTYLGSSGGTLVGDTGRGIAVDSAGNVYVTGDTDFSDFPVTVGAFDQTFNGAFSDAFVAELDNKGQLKYATYLGSSGVDEGHAIAVDSTGAVYVTGLTGLTQTADFPVKNAAQGTFGGVQDVFLVKLNPGGKGPGDLLYATYLGGTGGDAANAMVLSAPDRVLIAGETNSPNLATTSAYQQTTNGLQDAFVARFDTAQVGAASRLAFTYLGGTAGNDTALALTLDSGGAVTVTGQTAAKDFPTTADALDRDFVGAGEAFVSQLSAGLDQLLYSSLLGGSGDDAGTGIVIDGAGRINIAGWTDSADLPGQLSAPASFGYHGGRDAFVTRLDSNKTLLYSLYLGGSDQDQAHALAIDGQGQLVVVGETASTDLATVQASAGMDKNQGGQDALVIRLAPAADLSLVVSDNSPVMSGGTLEYIAIVHNGGLDAASNLILQTSLLDKGLSFLSASNGCSLNAGQVRCNLGTLAAGMGASVMVALRRDTAFAVSTSFTVVAPELDSDPTNNEVSVTTGMAPDVPAITVTDPGGSVAASSSGGGGSVQLVFWLLAVLLRCLRRGIPRNKELLKKQCPSILIN